MFIFISEKNCPSCGMKGDKWKKSPDVFICPQCKSYFNEFGVVVEPQVQEEVSEE
ncbi:MAG: rubredoxin [Candidatus Aenigmarchaeota archaeon]|nr:rubredoxin [Candidatus Aenigmarchaeota archaeon]